jgi:hypothetical protein
MSTKKQAVRRHRGAAPAPSSRARKQFDTIAARLRAETDLAEAWREALRQAAALARDELHPLRLEHEQGLKQLVLLLDRQRSAAGLDTMENAQLSDFIESILEDLLEDGGDPELEQLYQRYTEFDEEDELDEDEIKELMHDTLGVDISDVDLGTPEGLERLYDVLSAGQAAEEAVAERDQGAYAALQASMGALAQRMRDAAAAIAHGLGPAAQEGEGMDEDTRRLRDELHRRADAARAAGNLVDMLAVRFELEQHGLAAHLPEKQLAECNALLKEALQHTQLENAWHERDVAMHFPDMPGSRPKPALLLDAIRTDISDLQEAVPSVERDLRTLQDPKNMKHWLRQLDGADE